MTIQRPAAPDLAIDLTESDAAKPPSTTEHERVSNSFGWHEGRLHRTLRAGPIESSVSCEVDLPSGDDLGDWWRAYLSGRPLTTHGTVGPRRSLRSIDLFSGTGGLTVGFSRACAELGFGHSSEAAVDEDEEALVVHAANHHTKERIAGSVTMTIDYRVRDGAFAYTPEIIDDRLAALVGHIDVVIAGPPCQGHSNLNNRSRRVDRRNDLYLSVPAFAIALDAPAVIIENVPAVVHDSANTVEICIGLLQDAGYEVETGVLSATSMGWPQARDRYFLIAVRGATPIPLEEVQASLASPARSLTWAIADLEDRPYDDRMHLRTELSPENVERIKWLFDNDAYDLPLSERPDCHKDGTTYLSVYGRLHPDRPSPTITTGFLTPGRGRYIHPTRRRVLTPLEAARLQGFPDGYVFHPDRSRPSSKLKLTKWIGDAVPMPLGYAAAISVLGSGVAVSMA